MKTFKASFAAALTILAVGLIAGGAAPAKAVTPNQSGTFAILDTIDLATLDPALLNEAEATTLVAQLEAAADPSSLLATYNFVQLANVKAYLWPSDKSSIFKAPAPKLLAAYQNGCWNAAVSYVARNVFSVELYRLTLKGNWCTSGGLITSAVNQGLYPQISGMGWQAGSALNKGVYKQKTSAVIYGQYQFDYYVAGWFIQSDTPCLRIIASGDSSYTYDGVCGP